MSVSMGVVVFGDISGAAVSRVQADRLRPGRVERRAADDGADKRKRGNTRGRMKRVNLKLCGQHDAVPRYCSYWRKRIVAFFESYVLKLWCRNGENGEGRQSGPSVKRL
ncbi:MULTISPECIES: hypothetical protein [unclassified Pseudomonas]|uniref:hypothetical protein n=1 Tax=unclassified Pseudomonas TaxID=196821 RepID=UPI001482919C|nr:MULTISPECIES: hypothetical protein [unclassified Pseudomonas]MCX4221101.1 hypothetical protein [Pseudomonas sp. MCal1]